MGLVDINQAAWEMRISKEYQKCVLVTAGRDHHVADQSSAKCDYGSEESLMDTETFAVRVPKLEKAYTNRECCISGGDMYFQRSDSLAIASSSFQLTAL
jgi:hypothetical protein